MAEIAAKEAEKKAQDAEKAAEEARIKAEQAEQEAKEQAKIAKNTKKNKAEAESKAKNAEEKAKQAKAEADAALAEAEKAKKEAEEQAAAVSAYRAELITMMDDVLDVKIDALSKKDQKAVAEALGLQEVTEKNAKEKLREAFNQAKDQKDFDRMKQIYDSVKNGDQKSREVEKDKLLGDLYESYKNAIGGISKDQMKIVADSLGLEGAKPTNAKSMIDTEIKHAKDEKNVEKMQQIIAVIEQVRQQPEPEQQTAPEGVNAEPEQKEDEGNPDAKAGDMSGDNKAL